MERQEKHRPIEELDIMDDFLFNEILMKKEHGEAFINYFLKTVLGSEVEVEIEEVRAQMIYTAGDPNKRAIRMDVVTQGNLSPKEKDPITGKKKTTFVDVEMQRLSKDTKGWKKDNLRNRSRLYQSLLDINLLRSGQHFGEIPNVLIVLCMPFDLFERDRMMYTFEYYCKEEPDLILEDGAKRIFLNTKGKLGGSRELQDMLRYIERSTEENAVNPELENIHNLVTEVKQNKKVGVMYMLLMERDEEMREEGREEGIELGKELGRAEGICALIEDNLEENIPEERILQKLQRRFHLSEESASKQLERYMNR